MTSTVVVLTDFGVLFQLCVWWCIYHADFPGNAYNVYVVVVIFVLLRNSLALFLQGSALLSDDELHDHFGGLLCFQRYVSMSFPNFWGIHLTCLCMYSLSAITKNCMIFLRACVCVRVLCGVCVLMRAVLMSFLPQAGDICAWTAPPSLKIEATCCVCLTRKTHRSLSSCLVPELVA